MHLKPQTVAYLNNHVDNHELAERTIHYYQNSILPVNNAHKIFAQQLYYDVLHHCSRLEWLNGLPRLDALHQRLLDQSEPILTDPTLINYYNSADLEETDYIAELDRMAADRNDPAKLYVQIVLNRWLDYVVFMNVRKNIKKEN